MSQRISRRELLKTATAGAAVVGLTPLIGASRAPAAIPAAEIVQSLCNRGAFGELTYASGGSIEHYQVIRRWMRIAPQDHLATLVSRRDGAVQHVLLRTGRGELIELRLPTNPTTPTTGTLALHGTRGACRLGPAGDFVYLHGRTRGNQWEPLARCAAEFAASPTLL